MIVEIPIVKGSKIRFKEEIQRYTVRCIGERYAVCTKPMNAKKTVLYTVIDFEERVRGTENLVLGMGAETDQDCEEMLGRLEGREEGFSRSEVSHRNRIKLNILEISPPKSL